jgi:S-adenosylmethionine:diacylglycerol 3-amino-3-carboxypropyl transferase
MYEDDSIELAAFPPRGRIFCIASGGCTAMKLSAYHEVVAVDLNPVQVHYVRRRLAGAERERGIAERILAFGRALFPLAGWKKSRLGAFLDLDDPKEQIFYWRRHLNTRRFRIAFDFLFSRLSLRSIYSASFLNFLPLNFGAVLRGRMERCFALHPNRQNPYARLLLLGETDPEQKSAGAREVELVCADAAMFLESQSPGSFNGFSLSNIVDGTNAAYERRLFDAIKNTATPGAPVILRSFAEPQSPSPTNHAAEDRSMLWGVVDVRLANAL